MNKAVLVKELKKLLIPVVGGKYVRKKDVRKVLGLAADIERAYKVNENDEWQVFKLPCGEEDVRGVKTFDAFHFFCDGTTWVCTDDFWNQLKQAQKELYIFISKSKPKNNPLWKVATDDNEQTYLDSKDSVIEDIDNLNLPALKQQTPQATEDNCVCDIHELMRNGCKCGAVQRLKEKGQYSYKDINSSLKEELKKLGVRVKGNFAYRKDIEKVLMRKK